MEMVTHLLLMEVIAYLAIKMCLISYFCHLI